VIWGYACIRERCVVGAETSIGRFTYLDVGVVIGSRCKLQQNVMIEYPAVIANGVFIGTNVGIFNHSWPRATDDEGNLITREDFTPVGVTVEQGASICAGAIILPGVKIGERAMVGAGAIVVKDVPPGKTVVGTWKG
jgi:acetyltransferase-like isoleucine patch superfamily enzyme